MCAILVISSSVLVFKTKAPAPGHCLLVALSLFHTEKKVKTVVFVWLSIQRVLSKVVASA